MKGIRLAIVGFAVVIAFASYLHLENRTFNQLKDDQIYPMIDEPKNHPVPLTASAMKIKDPDIQLTRFYTSQNHDSLYFGIWYRGDEPVKEIDKNWKREKGAVQFLVKVVDSNGTTYNGTTVGNEEGAFSTFQYVQLNDYTHHEDGKDLEVYFYPIIQKEKLSEPYEHPVAQATVKLESK
ncbi:hypothetical protein LCL89_07700 [Halobacillus yeomjeoni]|uniref:hypothetical protein n=1 Tax=Halobacillus yeomjeoni TaxID=311194 RepID=UPI001CD30B95|nr:hypothetical protein [Halobacillus yeomjeoni]MCA0983944.1 hypothetical protein [Halobacillus yeomjeoni]